MICRFLRTIIYFNKVNTDVVITYGQRSSFLGLLSLWFRISPEDMRICFLVGYMCVLLLLYRIVILKLGI